MKRLLQLLAPLALTVMIGCGKDDDNDDEVTATETEETTVTTSKVSLKGSANSLSLALATSGINPSSVKVKVYAVAISKNDDCDKDSLVKIYSNSAPEYKDFKSSADFGEVDVEDGEYKCVVIEMSDYVKFTPESTSDNSYCVAGTEYTMDVFQTRSDGNGNSTPTQAKLIDGSFVSSTSGDEEQKMAIYLSTLSTTKPIAAGATRTDEGNAHYPPSSSDKTNGFFLDGSFKIEGAKTGTFYTDFTGRVAEESGNSCGMESPNWGFK